MKEANNPKAKIIKVPKIIHLPRPTLQTKKSYYIPEFYEEEPDGLMQKIVTDTLLSYVVEYQKKYAEGKIDTDIPFQICYKDFCKKMNYKLHWRSCKLHRLLGNLSDLCVENGLPPITAVIINKGLKRPGDGFFEFFYPNIPTSKYKKQFSKCLSDILECDEWETLREELLSIGEE